jgi:pumilio RNA-binding family
MNMGFIPTGQITWIRSDEAIPAQVAPSNPEALDISTSDVENALQQLSSDDSFSQQSVIKWVVGTAWDLANTYKGSRLVQKAFEVARGVDQVALRDMLKGRILVALQSPHANHVLQKCIELTPAAQLNFVIDELRGNAVFVARHRYGCRILERLFEHLCAELPTNGLMDEVVAEAAPLCRHSFANFVVQHVLEHGSPGQKNCIVNALLPEICRLAKHRVASHVVQCALVYASLEDKFRMKQAMCASPDELEDISKTQCGRFVAQEIGRV